MQGRKFQFRTPRSPVFLVSIVAIAALVLMAAACGDDDNSGSQASKTAAASQAGATGGSSATAASASGDNGGDAGDELKNLAGDWSKVNAKITYTFSSTIADQPTNFTMTMYSRPPDSRIDFDYGDQRKSITIDAGGKTYTCVPDADTCFGGASQGSATSSLPIFGAVADPDSIDSTVGGVAGLEKYSDNIAGEDVDCFKASGSAVAEQGELVWCFSNDGLLLLSSFKAAGSEFSTKATEVSRDVSDSDFEPPYPVTELPGG